MFLSRAYLPLALFIAVSATGCVSENEGTDTTNASASANTAPVAKFSLTTSDPSKVPVIVIANSSSSSDSSDSLDQLSFTWKMSGDDSSYTGKILNTSFDTAGEHVITLQVTDSQGALSTYSHTVNVTADPTSPLTFSVPSQTVLSGESVTFTAENYTDFTAEVWDFGDGSQMSGESVNHTYSQAGTFTVTLSAKSAAGVTNTFEQEVTISSPVVNTPPNIQATAFPLSGEAPLSVSFDASLSSDAEGDISSYLWAFETNSTSSAVSPDHTFDTPGTYEVSLTVEDEEGATAEETLTITVNEAPDVPVIKPTAVIDFDTLSGDAPLTVTLNGSRSVAYSEKTITAWTWTLADGTNVNTSSTTQTFETQGSYTIGLVVTDSTGTVSDMETRTITVSGEPGGNQAPVLSFTATPQTGPAPLTVSFDASGSTDEDGFVYGYEWGFEEGQTSNSGITSHTFEEPGTYVVSILVQDNEFAEDTGSVTITVEEPGEAGVTKPTAVIDANPIVGDAPLEVQFDGTLSTAVTDETVTGWTWTLPGDDTRTGSTLTHTFTDPGEYEVSLTVTDSQAVDSEAASITITVLDDSSEATVMPGGIYYVGNSVTDGVMYGNMESFASTRGKTYTWGRHMIPGSTFEWTWDHPNDGFLNPYGVGHIEALTEYEWDYLSLQPFDRPIGNDTEFASNFMDLALSTNPDTQTYIFAFYPRNQGDGGASWEDQWLGTTDTFTSKAFFETLASQLTLAFPDAKAVKIFPVGHVLYALKQKLDAGNIPSLDGQDADLSGDVDVWEAFYLDSVHMNDIGKFVVGMTVYASLFNEDPTGLDYSGYTGVNDDLAAEIQSTVWTIVQPYL